MCVYVICICVGSLCHVQSIACMLFVYVCNVHSVCTVGFLCSVYVWCACSVWCVSVYVCVVCIYVLYVWYGVFVCYLCVVYMPCMMCLWLVWVDVVCGFLSSEWWCFVCSRTCVCSFHVCVM